MLWLYRLLFLPALILGSPFYLRRMWRRGGYRENFRHRFGGLDPLPAKQAGTKRIWLQAVSVGEVLAIGPLLTAWQREGGLEIFLTITTSTAYNLARERYRDLVIGIGYYPLDWWCFSARAWRAVQPDLVILTEGERWPEHIYQASIRGVPVVSINARVSDRSFQRMMRVRPLVQSLLGGITKVLAGSTLDADRFREMGFPDKSITTTGSIKLDVSIPVLPDAEKSRLRQELGLPASGLVLMGSSTWEGEESVMIRTLQKVRAAGLACSLLLVPRHAERRAAIELMLKSFGVKYQFRSKQVRSAKSATDASLTAIDVAVVDTTGEMRAMLQLADVVFVGKSLPPHAEGQTPVESAILGRPILFGPGMGNFQLIARELVNAGAARIVANGDELTAAAIDLLGDSEKRGKYSLAGQVWHQQNVGAVERTLKAIKDCLNTN